jgi:hypothetical protein
VYSVDFATAYQECLAPNTTTSTGDPACAPAVTSSCTFSGASLDIRRRNPDAKELSVDVNVAGLTGPGLCPTGSYYVLLHMLITVDDAMCATGACTLIDLPIQIPLLANGTKRQQKAFVLESVLPGPVPAITNYEFLDAAVIDPNGVEMAAAGSNHDGADVKAALTPAYAPCTAPDTSNAWSAPACSGAAWASPCDFRFAQGAIGNVSKVIVKAGDLVGAPVQCSGGDYTALAKVRITTDDCGTLCTLPDAEVPLPFTATDGEIVSPFALLDPVYPFLDNNDTVELHGFTVRDPLGNLFAGMGSTPTLRLYRPRFFAAFRDDANPNDDKLTIKGRYAYPPLDPTVGGATFTAYDKDGVVYTVTIPAGSWEVRTPGRKWRYKDDLGTMNGVRKAEISETRHNGTANGYRVNLSATDVALGGANLPAIDLRVAASNPSGGTEVAAGSTICRVNARRASCK